MNTPRWFPPDDEHACHVLEFEPLDDSGLALELHLAELPDGGTAAWWLTERGIPLGPALGGDC